MISVIRHEWWIRTSVFMSLMKDSEFFKSSIEISESLRKQPVVVVYVNSTPDESGCGEDAQLRVRMRYTLIRLVVFEVERMCVRMRG